ncbi:MAG: nitroreductase family deazaflavin-dependent oxidoreductase [Anaerolineae bacterium]|jgi:deazaflavin-dependent oxidoreductase (nitroreductase family)|nr:nitroreductase family deazaflavin-dependent oxidoreductase [Anaerolineae bacterium]
MKNSFLKTLLNFPVWMYRLGLGWIVGFAPILILTTRGRKTGLARYTPLEYRRHGSKIYVVAAWGKGANWYQNLLHDPEATVKVGTHTYCVQATPVEDRAEATRVLYMFRRFAPQLYDPILLYLSGISQLSEVNLRTLPDIALEIALIRLDIRDQPPSLPPIAPDRVWVIPLLLLIGVVVSMFREIWDRLHRGEIENNQP